MHSRTRSTERAGRRSTAIVTLCAIGGLITLLHCGGAPDGSTSDDTASTAERVYTDGDWTCHSRDAHVTNFNCNKGGTIASRCTEACTDLGSKYNFVNPNNEFFWDCTGRTLACRCNWDCVKKQ
jgi:hypothetical protein